MTQATGVLREPVINFHITSLSVGIICLTSLYI